jgi:crotonobetainyl-CoA:carnitine CoA-transferase CaiB-like acyl-CoA transferase
VTVLPLDGIRVIDVTASLAGPYCTELLGALGADVVKVEHPQRGDDTRSWGPPFWNGQGVVFLAANANKRSLGLSLGSDAGRDVLRRLASQADVFVQSLRPGTAEARGLGAADLRASNERLVYCSIGAFGRRGPLKSNPGYDPLVQAAGGIMSLTGEPDRAPVRAGVSIVDQTTGMWALIGILAALQERSVTGAGSVVDVSLYETALGFLTHHIPGYLASGVVPRRHASSYPMIAPYQLFSAADGDFMVAAANEGQFARLCEVIGAPQLVSDSRFASNLDRVAHRDELAALLRERFATETVATWLDRLGAASVPAAPVHDVAEVVAHEQTEALGMIQPLPRPDIPDLMMVATPLSLDGERVLHRTPPPEIGEHSAAILAEAGYTSDEIDALAAAGTIRLRDQ